MWQSQIHIAWEQSSEENTWTNEKGGSNSVRQSQKELDLNNV
jgi:hypothetical protein